MTCITPKLQLPSAEEFGNYTVDFEIGFELDGYEKYRKIDEKKHNISGRFDVVRLSDIRKHSWPRYDSSSKEPLELEVNFTEQSINHEICSLRAGFMGNVSARGSHLGGRQSSPDRQAF
jgi:hypothetical protein